MTKNFLKFIALAFIALPAHSEQSCLLLDFSHKILESQAAMLGVDLNSEGFALLRKYVDSEAELLQRQINIGGVEFDAVQDQMKLTKRVQSYIDQNKLVSILIRSMNIWLKQNNVIQNEEKISKNKRAVVLIHQSNIEFQRKSIEALEKKFPDAATVGIISGSFPFGDRQFVQQVQKQGTFIYSPSGHMSALDVNGQVRFQPVEINAENITLMGGICNLCVKNTVQSLVENFLQKKDQPKLNLTFESDLIYTGETKPEGMENLRDRLNEVPASQRIFLIMAMYGERLTKADPTFKVKEPDRLSGRAGNGKILQEVSYLNQSGKEVVLGFE